jgi:hypothetical protein
MKLDADRFGPPRLVHSLDALDEEFERQHRLADEGYLRRWRGRTWAWERGLRARADDQPPVREWAWSDGQLWVSSAFTAFEDHEKAWLDVQATRDAPLHNGW